MATLFNNNDNNKACSCSSTKWWWFAEFICSPIILYAKYRSENKQMASELPSSAQGSYWDATAKLHVSWSPPRLQEFALFELQQRK